MKTDWSTSMALLTESRKKVGYDLPWGIRLLNKWKGLRNNHWGLGMREIFGALGPGFLVSVGYMDPVSYTHLTLPTNREV